MRMTEIFTAVFINIKENKFKVFLTSLGIIVGALTIVLVIGIGKGSQANVEEQFKRLNVGTLYIMPNFGGKGTETLSLEDIEAIKEEASSVSAVTIVVNGSSEVSYAKTSTSASIAGATKDFQNINNLSVAQGEFITDAHNEKRKKVAVIGAEIATVLFEEKEYSEIVGEDIVINGKRYEVIGVLERLGGNMPGFNPDEGIIVPYDVAEKYIVGKRARTSIMALAKDIDYVADAADEITQILAKLHKGKSDDFRVRDAGSSLVAAQDSAKVMTLLLMSIATIVLIVGGIGIMNVLFVSVKERTKEIGILKAIGARKKDILLQFLLESVVISTSGGLIGIFLSIMIIPLMKYTDISVLPSFLGYGMGLVFSIATGTFFGYYPAMKAANLKPIDALNYE
ncbi:ABC transporter permease [Marinisporobacter balticus]|uniref:Putative ABC transport system permease protein n=1 Tax=Marinisporobacter balticus TaxID=2018667 RepID=A0A4V2SBZ4_9FIRM|nr:ABC transporter permease [Marinisporobacter balticus]TCO77440.1 putative ABC transport system permease protein [Marinisporobacter balticus]